MLTAKLQPDEFSRGYRGRLQVLNNFRLTKSFMMALGKAVHPQDSQLEKFSQAETLAKAAGVSLETFMQSHSLLPLFAMVPSSEKSAKRSVSAQIDLSDMYGIKKWDRIGARFCLGCIKEEIESFGYAYWHRSHQLPGICWCGKHMQQLAIYLSKKDAFDEIPSPDMDVEYEFGSEEFESIISNEVVRRYADIIEVILDSNGSLSSMHAIYRMSELLKLHQIRIGKNGQRLTLTDRLLDQLPAAWLRSHYPSIGNRGMGEFFQAIDSIASRPVANHVYVLSLASLFESSNDAITYWFSNTDGLPKARKPNRRYGKEFWNSDELYCIYVKFGGNHAKLVENLGIGETYAKKKLKEVGLPSLWNRDMAALGEAISAIQLGMPIEMACASNAVRQGDVENLLKGDTTKLLRAIKKLPLKAE